MDDAVQLELYKTICLIRMAEAVVQKEYHNDEMKTPMHMSAGEEAIVAGVCLAMGKDARYCGTYRSHALYLAVTGETDAFFAELYGKATGVAGGKAGSMHLASPDQGLIMTSAVVGTSIPVAVGMAFANRYLGQSRRTAVFFGDGAVDEGVFWESLNLACLWKIPLLFVYEDNGLAIHTPPAVRHGYASIARIVEQFRCVVTETDSTDAEEIFLQTQALLGQIERNNSPGLLSCRYYRYLEHVGINEDFTAGYRSRDEFLDWYRRDPLAIQRAKLITRGKETSVQQIEKELTEQVTNSLAAAKMAVFPLLATLTEEVLA